MPHHSISFLWMQRTLKEEVEISIELKLELDQEDEDNEDDWLETKERGELK